MHDLDPIAFRQNRRCPIGAPRDIPVQLDRNSRPRERQFLDEIFQARSVRYFLALSVYLNAQDLIRELGPRRQDNFSQFRDFPARFGLNEDRGPAGLEIGQ